jgi:hypothetical protein
MDGRIPDRLFLLLSEQKTSALQHWKKSDVRYSSFFGVTSYATVFAGFLRCSGDTIDLRSEDFVTNWTVSQEIKGQATLSHIRLPAKLTFIEQQLGRIEYQDGDVIVELDSFRFDGNEAVVAFDVGIVDGAKKISFS